MEGTHFSPSPCTHSVHMCELCHRCLANPSSPYRQLVKLPTPGVKVAGLRNLRTGGPVCIGLFCSSVTMSSACVVASLRLRVYKRDSRPHFQNTWEESNKGTLLFLSLWLHHQIPGLTLKVELKATAVRLHKCDGQGSNLAAWSTEVSKARVRYHGPYSSPDSLGHPLA